MKCLLMGNCRRSQGADITEVITFIIQLYSICPQRTYERRVFHRTFYKLFHNNDEARIQKSEKPDHPKRKQAMKGKQLSCLPL